MNVEIKNNSIMSFGTHLLAELLDCEFSILNNKEKIYQALISAVQASGATLINAFIYKFPLRGVTGIVTLSESHICIHTWPNYKYAAVDIFMCGKSDPYEALHSLESSINPKSKRIKKIMRGIPNS